MERVYTGELSNEFYQSGTMSLCMKLKSSGEKNWAEAHVEFTKELRNCVADPKKSSFFRFEAETGEQFDLVAGGRIDLFSDEILLSSSGRVPGLL